MKIAAGISRANIPEEGEQSVATIWHQSAPRAVLNAYWAGRESAGWKAWRRYLRHRKPRIEPVLLLADENVCGDTADILRQWLDETAGSHFTLDYALAALQWCRRLPRLSAEVPAGVWWRLLNHLLRAPQPSDEPLVQQLLAGELALTLARLFPEIKACRRLLPNARRTLSAGLNELLDGKGLLHARHFHWLQPLLACWTRCRALGARLKRGCWNRKAERQYRRLVRNVFRLSRRDGTLFFSDSTDEPSIVALLRTVSTKVGAIRPSVHSEWAATAVLRPDASRSSPRLAVLYPGNSCRVELACGRDVLWSGSWALEVQLDGVAAVPTSDWSELCWVSDKDVDYLELEIELSEAVRVQRHILLSREDRFLLMADSVLASRRAEIAYRGTIPLCSGITFREACETRRGTLTGRKRRATALPLALRERLDESANGGLASTTAGLQLRQNAEGQALFAPLFFDLDRQRTIKPLTWRPLTVGQSWAVQPADVAVGYRVAIGKRQWLIYRSLTGPTYRSLLGHNLLSEMLVARFDRKGEVESLIEIE